jgi:hypothetical protein
MTRTEFSNGNEASSQTGEKTGQGCACVCARQSRGGEKVEAKKILRQKTGEAENGHG